MNLLQRCRIDLVVGTRPNIVKLGPLAHALFAAEWCSPRVVFLEQHSTSELGDDILTDLGVGASALLRIPLSSDDHGLRTGEMISRYSTVLSSDTPDLVIVFGDVDATFAAALSAKRKGLPVAHVEAGLRSYDHRMPEELNRLMVDAVADMFFATSEEAADRLVRVEGKKAATVHFVGNLMIDSLVATIDAAAGRKACESLGLAPGGFAIATFHRPSNVDEPDALREVIALLRAACVRLPVLLPLHPRTAGALERHGLRKEVDAIAGLRAINPIRYRDFISLVSLSRLVLTDSGGLQEETTFLGIPCLTLRENTERPVTITLGTNRLATHASAIGMMDGILAQPPIAEPPPIPLWDGRTASRMVQVLSAWWTDRRAVTADP